MTERLASRERRVLLTGLCLLTLPWTTASAQPTPTPGPEMARERPGRFRLGPIYLTPHVRIGSIGLDTNVFYKPTDRQADVSGSGGPALDVVIPIRDSLRLTLTGGANYLYFVRTASERRFVGDGGAELEWRGVRTSAELAAGYAQMFGRPSFEVDRRVEQTMQHATVELRRRLAGRTSLVLGGGFFRQETADGEVFLGTDLQRTMTQDRQSARAALEYALTAKTRLIFEGARDRTRFPLDASRDGDQTLAAFGIATESKTLLSGHAKAGVRWHEPKAQVSRQHIVYAAVELTWHVSPRMRLGGGYGQDLTYTAFETTTGSPIQKGERWRAFIERDIFRNLDLRLSGTRTRSQTDAPVRLEVEPGRVVEIRRDDVTYEASADLGYRFTRGFRMGITARYSERQSAFGDFGVDGLLLGGTVTFTP